jgi:hypothetical protein
LDWLGARESTRRAKGSDATQPAERDHGGGRRDHERRMRSISLLTARSVIGLRQKTSQAFITRPIPHPAVTKTGHGKPTPVSAQIVQTITLTSAYTDLAREAASNPRGGT